MEALEPWCDTLYTDLNDREVEKYIAVEQNNTIIPLHERIKPFANEKNNEILVKINASKFDQNDFTNIQRLSQIIKNSGQIGSFNLGNLSIEIVQMNEYQDNLINL